MTVALDHLLWAAPDLDDGARLFERLTGVSAAAGGAHPGFGTRNKLASLGEDLYLEIISPDPRQKIAGNRGGQIAALPHPGLLTFAVRSNDLRSVRSAAAQAGLSLSEPVVMNRTRPDGVRLEWSVLHLRHATLGEGIPFVIDWGASPHPSLDAPVGCGLRSLVALQQDPEPLRSIYRAMGIPVEVARSTRPGFVATLETPQGSVVLLSP